MKATIDAAGRLVIPIELRRQVGLLSGMEVDVRWHDGIVEIEPMQPSVRLVQGGRFLVATIDGEIAPLTAAAVEKTRESLRSEQLPLD